jgi:hypothetical protein
MNKTMLIAVHAAVGAGFPVLALAHAQGGTEFRAVKWPSDNERVSGMYCASAKARVIATNVFGGAGHIYAMGGQKITGTILTGDSKLAEKLGTLGEINFDGFSKVGNRLIANLEGAGDGK